MDSSGFGSIMSASQRAMIESMKPPRDYTRADYQYEILKDSITEFEQRLDPETEVAARIVSFGQNVVVHITDLGYSNPSLIHINGQLEDGSVVELIQHVSQINFLLVAAKRIDDSKPARRIGFLPASEEASG